MYRRALGDLLNPVGILEPTISEEGSAHRGRPDLVDIRPQLARLAKVSDGRGLNQIPRAIQENLESALQYLESHPAISSSSTSIIPQISASSEISVKRSTNVAVNRVTTVQVLYEYPIGHIVEYPETSSTGSIGHLFRMDPEDWQDPALNIAYSKGGRMGQSVAGATVKCRLLLDATGNPVDCTERHSTCEGCKICPNSDIDKLSAPHTKASREDVQARLQKDRADRLQFVSPSRDIFLKTLAYIMAIQKLGCSRPLFEATANFSDTEEELKDARDLYLFQTQRGYRMKDGLCEGRVVFDYGDDGRPYISCEHYNSNINKDHFHDHSIGDGSYHVEYIEAVFCGDQQEAAQIEDFAFNFGYGPLADCSTITNCSQQKAYCPFPHRDEQHNLIQPVMNRLTCDSKFRVFEPKPDCRAICPSHIRAYIKQALESFCPFGTGWSGVKHLKAQQDADLPRDKHYIRRIIAIDLDKSPRHDEDDDSKEQKDDKIRIIICMTPEASRRLLSTGRYLQSDIAFRRIALFLEFELACMDRDANTSLIFCRVYLNRQTAAAHQRIFEEIEAIVQEDTGKTLKWRHLHGTSVDGVYGDMILSWTADQHRGQAKGLGLHLQRLASKMPLKPDLHEPERNIQDLTPYEHLSRVFRVCIVHDFRNIQKCQVSDEVKWLMRSLVCVEHEDWDGALGMIREKGGKAGNDWVNDKESCQFFFPGICWERSHIPLDIWNAGDSNSNLIESVHADVNRDGVHCTLLGGLQKGQKFDALRMKTLITYEEYGITPSYKTGHVSENMYTNLKRKSNTQHRILDGEDQKIERYNEKLLKSLDALDRAEKAVSAKQQELSDEDRPEKRQKIEAELEKKQKTEERARKTFEKQHTERASLKRGSGKVARLECAVPE
ncbi:hypothetical protein C8R47DRAFT_1072982 [Mycena vitilis]|nr:hypothetical protein C8R47DRAFT_1072982 [Mycena vitilis]